MVYTIGSGFFRQESGWKWVKDAGWKWLRCGQLPILVDSLVGNKDWHISTHFLITSETRKVLVTSFQLHHFISC